MVHRTEAGAEQFQPVARARAGSRLTAHELRSPLAFIISETQKALSRQRSPEDYRRSLETCHEVAQEMRKLGESLLELSRLDERVPAVRKKLDLAKATEMSINKYTPLAASEGIANRYGSWSRCRLWRSCQGGTGNSESADERHPIQQ